MGPGLAQWLIRAACLAVGIGVGVLFARAPSAPPAPPLESRVESAPDDPRVPEGAGTCAPVVAQLQREIARLHAAPAPGPQAAEAPDPLAPRALTRPKDLPERFTQGPMLDALLAALKEAGIEGDITSVDCSEYPCVAVGRIGVGDFKALFQTRALAAYEGDHHPYLLYNVDGDTRPVAFTFLPAATFRGDPNAPDYEEKRAAWDAEQRSADNRVDMRMKEGLSSQPAGPDGVTYR